MFKNLKFNKNFIYLFFIVSAICFFSVYFKEEADIWFLLSHGKYIINHGFPYLDVLSMHTGLDFVMQQWLSSVIFYIIYEYLGKISFYVFIFLMNCLITFLIYKLCLVISDNKKFASCFISVIAIILLQIGYIVPRPQIFTYIILLMILIMLELFSSKRKKYIYLMPILSILLINFHASMWPILFIFCMPYVAELILKKDKDVYKLIIIMFISLLAGFINPYGLGAMTYSINCYGSDLIGEVVGEMRTFNLLGNPYTKVWSVFILFIFLTSNLIHLIYTKKKNFRVAHLLLFYGTFFMSLLGFRNIALFIIGTVPFLVKYLDIKDTDQFILNKKWIINYIVIILIFIGCFISALNDKKYEFIHKADVVISYFEKNKISKDIKLYTDYSDGSIFEYHGYKPYIDSRAEVFLKKMNHKENILKEYLNFNLDEKTRDKFIKKYDFDYYVIGSMNLDLVNYLLNYDYIKYDLVFANEEIFLIKKVS